MAMSGDMDALHEDGRPLEFYKPFEYESMLFSIRNVVKTRES